MADYTQDTLVLAPLSMIVHDETPGASTRIHTPVSVASFLSGRVYIFMVNLEGTANVDGVTFRIQGRANAPASHWADIQKLVSSTAATRAPGLTLGAIVSAGESVIEFGGSPVSDFDIGDECYVRDTNGASPSTATADLAGAEAQGEFFVVLDSEAGAADEVTLGANLAFDKDTSDELVQDAQVLAFDVPNFGGYAQLRLMVSHEGATGGDIHYRAHVEVATDIE
jgi:hypothetical protein